MSDAQPMAGRRAAARASKVVPPVSLKELRAARRIATQDDLAAKTGGGGNYMSRWQRAFSRTPHGTMTGSDGFSHSYAMVIQALASHADFDTGQSAHPGVSKLIAYTGLSASTIGRATRWAESAGWIERVRAAVKGTSVNVYKMTFPPSDTGHL